MNGMATLVASRKNSKFLAKFLHSYKARTRSAPLYCMYHAHDWWNGEVIEHFASDPMFHMYAEDEGLGRGGLHVYYQMLAERSEYRYEWYAYFCEDHHIIVDGWDELVSGVLGGYDARLPYIAVPGWDNIGSVTHIVSRGYLKALGGRFAEHGNLDSYINDVAARIPQGHVIRLPIIGHDFTHDVPSVMDDRNTKADLSVRGRELDINYFDESIQTRISKDARMINNAIRRDVA